VGFAAALWAYGPDRFDKFDQSTVELLRRGLQLDIALRAFTRRGIARNGAALVSSLLPGQRASIRSANRTDALPDRWPADDVVDDSFTRPVYAGRDLDKRA
jgi:NTE family protein